MVPSDEHSDTKVKRELQGKIMHSQCKKNPVMKKKNIIFGCQDKSVESLSGWCSCKAVSNGHWAMN